MPEHKTLFSRRRLSPLYHKPHKGSPKTPLVVTALYHPNNGQDDVALFALRQDHDFEVFAEHRPKSIADLKAVFASTSRWHVAYPDFSEKDIALLDFGDLQRRIAWTCFELHINGRS